MSLRERFWTKVQIGAGCWNWTANRGKDGYDKFKVGGKFAREHGLDTGNLNRLRRGLITHHKGYTALSQSV